VIVSRTLTIFIIQAQNSPAYHFTLKNKNKNSKFGFLIKIYQKQNKTGKSSSNENNLFSGIIQFV
jgi:hypothetical protein